MSAPPRSTPRVERKRQDRRDRIVQAAMTAVAEQGPADFSVNQLARDLDYTPGALYWYFPSKEVLVAEVQRIVLTRVAALMRTERARWLSAPSIASESPAVTSLYALLRQSLFYLRLERTHRIEARVLAFSVDPRVWLDEEQTKLLFPVLADLLKAAAEGFVLAMEAGALDTANPGHRAMQYWANNQGAAALAKLARFRPDVFQPEKLGMDGARSLLLGWGAPRDALQRAWDHVAMDMTLG